MAYSLVKLHRINRIELLALIKSYCFIRFNLWGKPKKTQFKPNGVKIMAKQSRIAHLTDEQLTSMTAKEIAAQFYNGNVGAAWNALDGRGLKGKPAANDGKKTTVAIAVSKATVKPVAPIAPEFMPLPGRVVDFMIDNILPEDWNDEQEIPQHFVELVVLSDTVDWNKRIRRFGAEEIEMLESFLCAPCTMNRREDALLAKRARAPFERTEATINHHARIDAGLLNAENRFEASRYDADITAFYCE